MNGLSHIPILITYYFICFPFLHASKMEEILPKLFTGWVKENRQSYFYRFSIKILFFWKLITRTIVDRCKFFEQPRRWRIKLESVFIFLKKNADFRHLSAFHIWKNKNHPKTSTTRILILLIISIRCWPIHGPFSVWLILHHDELAGIISFNLDWNAEIIGECGCHGEFTSFCVILFFVSSFGILLF